MSIPPFSDVEINIDDLGPSARRALTRPEVALLEPLQRKSQALTFRKVVFRLKENVALQSATSQVAHLRVNQLDEEPDTVLPHKVLIPTRCYKPLDRRIMDREELVC